MHPSSAEYWHIGAITIRLASSSAPNRIGENSFASAIAELRRLAALGSSERPSKKRAIPRTVFSQKALQAASACRNRADGASTSDQYCLAGTGELTGIRAALF